MMLSITYISTAAHPLDNSELAKLLDEWRDRNQKVCITGLLLYKAGSFIQTIEGADSVVLALFERIKLNPLHRNVIAVLQETIHERHFANWSMGFQLLEKLPEGIAPDFSTLLTDPQLAENFEQSRHRVDKLHWMFREISSRP